MHRLQNIQLSTTILRIFSGARNETPQKTDEVGERLDIKLRMLPDRPNDADLLCLPQDASNCNLDPDRSSQACQCSQSVFTMMAASYFQVHYVPAVRQGIRNLHPHQSTSCIAGHRPGPLKLFPTYFLNHPACNCCKLCQPSLSQDRSKFFPASSYLVSVSPFWDF